jgi:hypothetical protein
MTDALTQWESLEGRRVTVPEHVVFRSFVSETVLMNIQTGYYHGLDEVGGRFFERLRTLGDPLAAARSLAEEYEQPVERIQEDMVPFCAELHSRGLIALDDPAG